MPNAQKIQTVADLREVVAQSNGAILTEYRGLTVAEISELRKRLRAVNGEYHVVKNTLFKLVAGDTLTPELENLLAGPTAIVFSKGDVVASTKTTLDFLSKEIRNRPEIMVKGGWIDGKIYSVEQVTALSKLPGRDQLIAQVVGTIQAPLSEFVGTLDNIISEFVRTIQAIADKQGGGEAVAA